MLRRYLSPIQLEMFIRAAPGMMIPAVGKQPAADIGEPGCDWHVLYLWIRHWDFSWIGLVMA